MELKVFNNAIAAYGGRWETRLELPVETEILIPDYMPAVFKIVKCLIEPVVMQNNIASGRWQGEGYLRCTVYYQSDEAGTRLYRTEQKFSFEKSVELPAGHYVEGPARLWGELEYCNCRAVSEHRIDLRGAYTLCAAAVQIEDCELLSSLADCGIEQRTESLDGVFCAAAEEKTFNAETTLPLPASGEAVLDISGSFVPQGVTIQTGQANCKGTLKLEAVYRGVNAEELSVCQKELTVQQSVALAGAAEGDECCCWGEVLGCSLAAAEAPDTEEPVLTVTWKLHIELWRAGTYMAVADAYSTLCQTTVTRAGCKLLQKRAEIAATAAVTVEDDLPDPDAVVRGCFVTLGAPLAAAAPTPDGTAPMTVLAGKGTAHILCSDARGEMTCYDKTFTWQLPDAWPGEPSEFLPHLHADVTRVASAKNGVRMKVELEVTVGGLLLQSRCFEVIGAVELGEEYPDKADGPALYLYYAAEGERVFDIAKRYHARARDLAAANKLEAEAGANVQELTTGAACLLIPAAL